MPKFKKMLGGKKKQKSNEPSLDELTQVSQPQQSTQTTINTREPDEVNPQMYIHTDAAGGRNREMILHYVGIHEDGEAKMLNQMVTPEEVGNIEFSETVPTGLDASEVEQFCDTIEANILRYRQLIEKLNDDKEKLVAEVLRVDAQAQQQKEETLMQGQFGDNSSQVNKLNERIIALQNTVKQQKEQLNKVKDSSKYEERIKELEDEVNSRVAKDEVDKLNTQVSKLTSHLSSKDNEIKELNARIETFSKQDDNKLAAENDNLKAEIAELKNKLSEIDTANERIKEQRDEIGKLEHKITELSEERDNALRVSSISDSDSQKQIDELTSKYKAAIKERDELQRKFDNLPKVKSQKQAEEARIENLKLKEQLKTKENGISPDNSDYEDEVFRKLEAKQAKPKAKKRKALTKDDIKNMQAEEAATNFTGLTSKSKGNKPRVKKTTPMKESTSNKSNGGDNFDSMFDDMQNNY